MPKPPEIAKCEPDFIVWETNQVVRIVGKELDAGSAVVFIPAGGGNHEWLTIKQITFVSRSTIDVTVRADESADFTRWHIRVTNHDGQLAILQNALLVVGRARTKKSAKKLA